MHFSGSHAGRSFHFRGALAACDPLAMAARVHRSPSRPWRALALALSLAFVAAGCSAPAPPFAQLSGLVLDTRLADLSGLAASHVHADTLWAIDDGGNAPRLFAIGNRGGVQAAFRVAGIANTDWEDLASFDLDHRHYLLIADTGDNGGLRKTLQLHVVEEPASLAGGTLQPAWSIAFRWPDGPRDCEAVAVDAAHGQVLLISKRRRPPDVFALPLRPPGRGLQVARRIGSLSGMPRPDPGDLRDDPALARMRDQVTAADLSPDGRTLAVLTYRSVLFYAQRGPHDWAATIRHPPRIHALSWLPQAEALAWAADGQGLYAAGEHSPSPLLYLNP